MRRCCFSRFFRLPWTPPYEDAALRRRTMLRLPGTFDARRLGQVAVDAGHPLHLALGREALVEALVAELPRHLGPRGQALLPAREAAGFLLAVLAGEVGAHAHHRPDGDRLGHHVVVLAPHRVAEHGARRLEEVAV